MQIFLDTLRKILKERNWRQRHLAQAMGVHHSCVSRMLMGEYTPSLNQLDKVARALDVPSYELIRP